MQGENKEYSQITLIKEFRKRYRYLLTGIQLSSSSFIIIIQEQDSFTPILQTWRKYIRSQNMKYDQRRNQPLVCGTGEIS